MAAHEAFHELDVLPTYQPSNPAALDKTGPGPNAEVLSPSAGVSERRERLLAYRALESLDDDLLLSQDRRLVEVQRREAPGGWRYAVTQEGELTFTCGGIDIRLSLADLYVDLTLG